MKSSIQSALWCHRGIQALLQRTINYHYSIKWTNSGCQKRPSTTGGLFRAMLFMKWTLSYSVLWKEQDLADLFCLHPLVFPSGFGYSKNTVGLDHVERAREFERSTTLHCWVDATVGKSTKNLLCLSSLRLHGTSIAITCIKLSITFNNMEKIAAQSGHEEPNSFHIVSKQLCRISWQGSRKIGFIYESQDMTLELNKLQRSLGTIWLKVRILMI